MSRIVVAGNLSLDDTLSPGGFRAEAPGGDALYASLGVAAFGERPEILTLVGEYYPAALVERMIAAGLDTHRLRRVDGPTVHYRVTNESDGSRRYDWISTPDRLLLTSPTAADYVNLAEADWLHLAAMPIEAHETGIAAARSAGVPYSLDPHEEYVVGFEERLRWLIRGAAFLPSELEVRLLFPDLDARDPVASARVAAERLTSEDWGAVIVGIKLGERGAIVKADGRTVYVPAEAVEVTDTVGAGDAWCGGFVTAWLATRSIEVSAACGNVAAADTIRTFGAFGEDGPSPIPAMVARAAALLDSAGLMTPAAHAGLDRIRAGAGAFRG